jgi:hypothetical protein
MFDIGMDILNGAVIKRIDNVTSHKVDMGKIGKLNNAFDLILHGFSTRSGIQPGTKIGNRSKSKYYRKFEFPATSTPQAKTGTDPTHAES